MKSVLIFGTGSTSRVVCTGLQQDVLISAFVDNDSSKWGKLYYYSKKVISPYDINNYHYDYIIIASQFNEEIYNQLLDMGIDKKKIFQFFKFVDLYCNTFNRQMDTYIKCEKK